MNAEVIRDLYRYHFWVNDLLMAEVSKLSAEQTQQRFGASFDSILGTIAHLASAENFWLSRWRGTAPSQLPSAENGASVDEILAGWHDVRKDLQGFLDGLTDEQVASQIRWENRTGKSFSLPLWEPMFQVVNHGTHHRSELCEMLTRLGFPPPTTDAMAYFQQRTGQG